MCARAAAHNGWRPSEAEREHRLTYRRSLFQMGDETGGCPSRAAPFLHRLAKRRQLVMGFIFM